MNFHSDKWIMERLSEHYKDACSQFDKNRIVGIFYQGSGNYGLDYEGSDVDTKCIIVPTVEELALGSKPTSFTYIRHNDEHIDFKDIRQMIEVFQKRNLNFIEILFTKYRIINPIYQDLWDSMDEVAPMLTSTAQVSIVRSLFGIASEKFHALEHPYPSRMDWINKFKYDPKQLHHLVRLKEMLDRIISGETFQECLHTNNATFLNEVKVGKYELEDARIVAKQAMEHISSERSTYQSNHQDDDSGMSRVNAILTDIKVSLIKRGIVMGLTKECN